MVLESRVLDFKAIIYLALIQATNFNIKIIKIKTSFLIIFTMGNYLNNSSFNYSFNKLFNLKYKLVGFVFFLKS